MDESLLPLRRADHVPAYSKLISHMPFYGIYGQSGVMVVKGRGFKDKLWLGSESAPGSGEGQEYVDDNIRRPSLAQKGWGAHSAGQAEVQVARPVTIGGCPQRFF
jgi:hypothetical protein